MAEHQQIDSSVPHSARIWNHWLGGKDNYPVDREVGDEFVTIFPQQVDIARHSRAFLGRAVRHLAGEAGIRQFLDVGTGLPTVDNTHEVAQRAAPDARIVYVDNDPLVLMHARALLTSTPEGVTSYVDADVRDPDLILAKAAETLDLDRPVALLLLGILGHLTDDEDPEGVLARLVAPLAPGSHVVVNDGTNVFGTPGGDGVDDTARARAVARYVEAGGVAYNLRSPDRIAGYFAGLELLDPGVVTVSRWRAEPSPFGPPPEVDAFCGVARLP
ncbi:SAM-dependent methyltransferase [Actinomadura darangshiensis]|uniref:SAM-dependent methyltransferase n=1 Tax=Actinomadura darangshiensis TaxID=705336 RepID=A0A4R4ZXB0_9ACTN|nr:SAM-dependent methyltransferase [Actinomadura darangshiensis]TDD63585.1 SAM-dependent methyltransferase [Actinomadura darangshiensis]